MFTLEKTRTKRSHLTDHPVPLSVYVLPMPAICHQVEVVGETHNFGQSLEDIDAETFAAMLHGVYSFQHHTVDEKRERSVIQMMKEEGTNKGINKENIFTTEYRIIYSTIRLNLNC